VSNITAGTMEQINAVIESGCIVPIVHLLTHGEIEIKREAAWAISNATSAGELSQIQHLVQYGCMPPLCQLLREMDQRVVLVRASNSTLPGSLRICDLGAELMGALLLPLLKENGDILFAEV
jgi:hypothetical protein